MEQLHKAFKLDPESLGTSERVGLLLLSAAYCGGLMDLNQLRALLRISLEDIDWLAGIPEIRLSLAIRRTDDAEYRQWFPDPGTLALLVRYTDDVCRARSSGMVPSEKGMIKCIRALLSKAGAPRKGRPRSMAQLLDLLRMQMHLRLPQLLANFASRRGFVSHSIRPSGWGDIFGGASLTDPVEAYGNDRNSNVVSDALEAPGWLLELCKGIRAGKPTEALGEDSGELADLMQQWTSSMLTGTTTYGNSVGRDTVARYARLLGPALTSQLDSVSIFRLETDALEKLYESALEIQDSDGKRRTLAKAIQEFHTFLQRRYSYPPISAYSLLGIGKDITRADARVLSEDQYRLALEALGNSGLELRTPELVTAARLFLILGFRLGLRRNEALKLRLQDLHIPELSEEESTRLRGRHPHMRVLSAEELASLELPVDLLIRPHALRMLKSQNSVRRLPLNILLEPEELKLLIKWHQKRIVEEAANPTSEFLFCIPLLRTQWISENCLMPALHSCMRAATGCANVHYHHLRHSCATWLLLKLMTAAGNLCPEIIFRDLPHTIRWLKDDARLKHAFLPADRAPTRRILHLVSAVLGHGRPKTTLLHYIHSLPQIMAMFWQWNPEHWLYSANNVATLAGVSQPTKSAETEGGIPVDHRLMLDIIGRIKHLKRRRKIRHQARQTPVQSVNDNWAIERIRTIESMLAYVSYSEQTGREVNLEWLEFPAEDRAQMLDRARYIHGMSRRPGDLGTGSRHRLQAARYGEGLSLLPTPPKHGGRAAVTAYAQKLYELLEGPHRERAQRVVDDFIERCWRTETTQRFQRDRDEEHAQDYLWLLREIGIRSIQLVIYDTRKTRRAKTYWRQQLGNTRLPVVLHHPENPDVENAHLGIRAFLELPHHAAEDGRPIRNHHPGSALRYLMLMASIDWHHRG
jgi:integrase